MPELRHPSPACAVPVGGRVIVVSDLFLGAKRTEASGSASLELARAARACRGPGALVVAGNAFDLLVPAGRRPVGRTRGARGAAPSPWPATWRRTASAGPSSSRATATGPSSTTRRRTRRSCAAGFEVALDAPSCRSRPRPGPKQVCIDPGWRYDERNAFVDPADPRDTPLGHHAVAEILPALAGSSSTWLDGIDRLADPSGLPRFVASRLTYRRIVRWLWWLLRPDRGRAFRHGSPTGGSSACRRSSSRSPPGCSASALTLVVEVIVAGIVLAVVNHRVWHSAGPLAARPARAPGQRRRP